MSTLGQDLRYAPRQPDTIQGQDRWPRRTDVVEHEFPPLLEPPDAERLKSPR